MAYQGFLIKVGNYTIPMSMIKASDYSVLQSGQDLDSYRDANGELHRQALSHTLIKVEFNLKPMLTNTEMASIMSNIRANYTNVVEKKCIVTAYIPEIDDYVTVSCYMPDITYSIYGTYGNVIHYNNVRLAFIQY